MVFLPIQLGCLNLLCTSCLLNSEGLVILLPCLLLGNILPPIFVVFLFPVFSEGDHSSHLVELYVAVGIAGCLHLGLGPLAGSFDFFGLLKFEGWKSLLVILKVERGLRHQDTVESLPEELGLKGIKLFLVHRDLHEWIGVIELFGALVDFYVHLVVDLVEGVLELVKHIESYGRL